MNKIFKFFKMFQDGYGDIEAGCRDCQCDLVGSLTASTCDVQTGQCNCKTGVGGLSCNQCLENHYDFSINGCQGNAVFLSLFIIFHVHHPSGPTTTQNFTKERNLIETKQTAVSFERENVSTRRRKQKKNCVSKSKFSNFGKVNDDI